MDINNLRSAVTLLSLGLFVGLMWWTWRPAGRAANEAAAQLPFIEPPLSHETTTATAATAATDPLAPGVQP